MTLPDEQLDFVLEMVAFVGIMAVVVVKATVFGHVPSRHVFPNRGRPLVRSIVDSSLKNLCSSTYQARVVGEPWLVLKILRALVIVARRLLGPLIFLILAVAGPVLARVFFFLRAVLL